MRFGFWRRFTQTFGSCDLGDVCGDKDNEADNDGITMLSGRAHMRILEKSRFKDIEWFIVSGTFVIGCVLLICLSKYSIHATEPAETFP